METRLDDIKDIQNVFESFGVRLILVYGALLGFYRDKNFLPEDDDIDFAVIDKVDYETRKAIGWRLYDLGFLPQQVAFNVFNRMETQEAGYNGDEHSGIIVCARNFKFTIFFFGLEDCAIHGNEYVCTPKLHAMKLISTPAIFFEKLGMVKFKGLKFLTPSPIEAYLANTYFNNWKDKTDRRHGLLYNEQHK